ncbi:rhodanese-like domain-containing protein [Maribacter aestuarii]|uniref:rhodanese-like domain-containing protein n=1 Tax=Maribacter aestuarii TaxID=1130723 RepID=UPI00248A917B|nr:rhodanese-like domain-containing protein [Maribacter aestuarii]
MAFFHFLFGKNEPSPNNVEILPSTEFLKAAIDKGEQLIDVRTYYEYDKEHINGAINIDWFQPSQFNRAIRKIDKERPVYVYCRTGNRSQKAARKIAELGFVRVFDLKGGINAAK